MLMRHEGVVAAGPDRIEKVIAWLRSATEGEGQRDRQQEEDRAVGRAVFRVHRPEPARQVAVAAHREPGTRGIVDAAIGRGDRRQHRSPEEQDLEPGMPVTRAASKSGEER